MMDTKLIKKNIIVFIVGFISCLYYYLLGIYNLIILPYLIVCIYLILNFKNLELTLPQIITLLFLTSYFVIINNYNENLTEILKNFQYWFGIIFFLIFINNFRIPNLFYKYLFLFLCLQILLEITLVNSISEIKNFLQYFHSNEFFGFYNRPIGFAGSTSSSITIICAVFCFLKYDKKYQFHKYEYFLFILCILLSFSYTGYIIFLCIFLYEIFTQKKINFKIILLGLISISLILVFQELYTSNIRSPINHFTEVINYKYLTLKIFLLETKLSLSHSYDNYILNLFSNLFSINNLNNFSIDDLKSISLNFQEIPKKDFYTGHEFIFTDLEKSKILNHKSIEESIFGTQIYWPIRIVGGDFSLISMLNAVGVLGFILYFFIIFLFGKNFKNIAFLILIFGSLHYGAIMSVCGQFVLAMVISKKN